MSIVANADTDFAHRVSVALSFGHISVEDTIERNARETDPVEPISGRGILASEDKPGDIGTHDAAEVEPVPPENHNQNVHDSHAAVDEHLALLASTKAGLDNARDVVEKKSVVLEKLGRARLMIELIHKAGEFVGEVSLVLST